MNRYYTKWLLYNESRERVVYSSMFRSRVVDHKKEMEKAFPDQIFLIKKREFLYGKKHF